MKKFSLFILISFLFAFSPVYAGNWSGSEGMPTPILSGHTIYASGTSTFIIDAKYYKFKEGNFSIQLSEVTCAWIQPGCTTPVFLSGATINAYCRWSDDLGSGVTHTGLMIGSDSIEDKLEQLTIFSDLNIQTGNTRYVWEFFPDKARFLIIDITAGATSVATSIYFDGD